VSELEAAKQRIAELEEKLEQTQRQLDLLVRQVFGKKSEQSRHAEPDQLKLELEIDNNLVENAIRPCSLGKKNWLFIGDVRAGQRTATLYSLLGSCLRRKINPRAYLTWLFDRLPQATNLTVHTLTPAAYAAAQSGDVDLQGAA